MRQRPGQTKSANRVRSPGKWTRYSNVEPSGRVLGSWPNEASRWKRNVWASLFSSPLSLAANWAKSRKPFSSDVMKRSAACAPQDEHGSQARGGQGSFCASHWTGCETGFFEPGEAQHHVVVL